MWTKVDHQDLFVWVILSIARCEMKCDGALASDPTRFGGALRAEVDGVGNIEKVALRGNHYWTKRSFENSIPFAMVFKLIS